MQLCRCVTEWSCMGAVDISEAAHSAGEEGEDGHPQQHEQHCQARQGNPHPGASWSRKVHPAESYGWEAEPAGPEGDACTPFATLHLSPALYRCLSLANLLG